MKKCALIMAGAACLGLCILACGERTDNSVIARVGSTVLTVQQIQEHTRGLEADAARMQAQLYIQRWIESEVLYQEALRRGIEKKPEVQSALKEMTRDYIITSFVDQAANEALSVSDVEIQNYYQEQKEEFQSNEDLYHLFMILVASQNDAIRLRAEIKAGTPFREIASRYSIDGSRLQDGEMGHVPLSSLSPLLARAVASLRPGEISAPLKSEVGYNILQLVDIQRKGTLLPLEAVRPLIQQRILARKKEDNYQRLIARLSDEAALYTDLTKLEMIKEKE
jgi:peptidyl-prolyl cis-trans isomerase C